MVVIEKVYVHFREQKYTVSVRSNVDFVWEHPITSLASVLYEKEEKEKLWKSWVYYTVLKEEKEEKEK